MEPYRKAYSKDELGECLRTWMVEEFGIPKDITDPDERDSWHEKCGLIYHFICCHFPDSEGNYFDYTPVVKD